MTGKYILIHFFIDDEMFVGFIHIVALYIYTFIVWLIGATTTLMYCRVHAKRVRPMRIKVPRHQIPV
jgi:hypothetical protein